MLIEFMAILIALEMAVSAWAGPDQRPVLSPSARCLTIIIGRVNGFSLKAPPVVRNLSTIEECCLDQSYFVLKWRSW